MRFAIYMAIAMIAATTSSAQDFKVCKSTYALCTIAPCKPIPGNDKEVACLCTVNTGYSLGQEPCSEVKDTPDGRQIKSRYYPVHSYAVCSNDWSWANCLDSPCTIDKNNPTAAICACGVVKNVGDYVIVTSRYTPTTCTTGTISSATVKAATEVTDYLKAKAPDLPPFNIEILYK